MKFTIKSQSTLFLAGAALFLTSCGSGKVVLTDTYTPEEGGLNLVKITDESSNSVISGVPVTYYANSAKTVTGTSSSSKFAWSTPTLLAISPDGTKLAYCSRQNRQDNIMVRSTTSAGVATQRTFRNTGSFCYGNDGKLYFTDYNGSNSYICSVNADAGSMMTQHTNGNVNDFNPVISSDGEILFFTRMDSNGPGIWSLNKKDGTLTSCARGYNPCLIPGKNDAFYCVRNSTAGRSEIWYVNYVKGEESLVLSDEKRSFTNPSLSPNGRWIACVGNAKDQKEKNNLDIFVVRTDGTGLTQLTYHSGTDTNPVWSKDGNSIFFLSSRANKADAFNIWRMNFNLF